MRSFYTRKLKEAERRAEAQMRALKRGGAGGGAGAAAAAVATKAGASGRTTATDAPDNQDDLDASGVSRGSGDGGQETAREIKVDGGGDRGSESVIPGRARKKGHGPGGAAGGEGGEGGRVGGGGKGAGGGPHGEEEGAGPADRPKSSAPDAAKGGDELARSSSLLPSSSSPSPPSSASSPRAAGGAPRGSGRERALEGSLPAHVQALLSAERARHERELDKERKAAEARISSLGSRLVETAQVGEGPRRHEPGFR